MTTNIDTKQFAIGLLLIIGALTGFYGIDANLLLGTGLFAIVYTVLLFMGVVGFCLIVISILYNPQKDKQKPDRYCPGCGHNIPFDARICPYCSKKFEVY